jgi:hypothetical protein
MQKPKVSHTDQSLFNTHLCVIYIIKQRCSIYGSTLEHIYTFSPQNLGGNNDNNNTKDNDNATIKWNNVDVVLKSVGALITLISTDALAYM